MLTHSDGCLFFICASRLALQTNVSLQCAHWYSFSVACCSPCSCITRTKMTIVSNFDNILCTCFVTREFNGLRVIHRHCWRTHDTNGMRVCAEPREMRECGRVRHHGWVLPNHIRCIDSVPLNGIYGAISIDIDCSATNHRLCTFRFCFPLFLHVCADHPNGMSQCAFVDGWPDGNPCRKLFTMTRNLTNNNRKNVFETPTHHSKHDERRSYSHNESIVHDYHAFRRTRICSNKKENKPAKIESVDIHTIPNKWKHKRFR